MSANFFTLPSFAKINLILRVVGKRADDFHEICTVFQTVSLCDFLTFSRADTIDFSCDDAQIPLGAENIIVRAAGVLRERYKISQGARIHLEKRIPAPGGLGGGSSNAAVALCGLVRLWNLKVKFADLCEIGAELGSDVPFFFHGGTAFGSGRGTDIRPLADFNGENLLIVTPNAAISTREAFAALQARDLTNKSSKSILEICFEEANAFDSRHLKLKNDFEATVFETAPATAQAKEKLLQFGAADALLSGSGASVFGIFDSDAKRSTAFAELKKADDWRVFSVQTVSRESYEESLNFDDLLSS